MAVKIGSDPILRPAVSSLSWRPWSLGDLGAFVDAGKGTTRRGKKKNTVKILEFC
jgi:hypothetical protein